jgi:putative ABC transport system permease protein
MFKALSWILIGRWREQPSRLALSVFAVALGVALGLAIHLVNRSALAEFADAIALVNGQAQRQVTAASGPVDEAVFEALAVLKGIAISSPVIELQAEYTPDAGANAPAADSTGRKPKLKLLGLDLFRAAAITPELVIIADPIKTDDTLATFNSDQVFLSNAALKQVQRKVGDSLTLKIGESQHTFLIAGRLSQVPSGQALAAMDIATLQWRAPVWLGKLSRIDIKLDESVDKAQTDAGIQKTILANSGLLRVETPQAATQRISNVSRAYRVNLAVLGMVALVVGGFLVFSTMSLLAQRQMADAAILSLMGLRPTHIRSFVLLQGLLIGALGSALGVAIGVGLSQAFLSILGGDLGGGYFNGSTPQLRFSLWDISGFALMGIAMSIIAAWPAANQLMNNTANPMSVLLGNTQANSAPEQTISKRVLLATTCCLALAAGALFLPPIADLPLGGFAAMGLVLIAGIAVVPWLTKHLAQSLLSPRLKLWKHPALWLAAHRLGAYPKAVSVALAGIVASVALASAMAIMVHSFRDSVNNWLSNILPADLYVRSASRLNSNDQKDIRALPGVARAEFLRAVDVSMRMDLPAVAVIGRSADSKPLSDSLPLVGTAVVSISAPTSKDGIISVFGSEAMVDLYGWKNGDIVPSPMGGVDWRVAGIWRDYGRQHGAIAMDIKDLERITGNGSASDIAVWLSPGSNMEAIMMGVKKFPGLANAEARSSEAIRSLSLKIFDRSFALTYVIEAIAILVALFGVASTYAGEALSRMREFGTLQHLGAKVNLISKQLIFEALIAIFLAVMWGATIGLSLAWILVRRINPQSFHWSMDFSWPSGLLVVSGLSLLALGVASALLAYRSTLKINPVQAIKH